MGKSFVGRGPREAARLLAAFGVGLLALLLLAFSSGSARAQSVCTITASASRSDSNVSGSGQLNLLRVPGDGAAYAVFKIAADSDPESLVYACATSTLASSPRFEGNILNGAGTNNRALLTTGWTFTFNDGSSLTRPSGSSYVFFTPVAGQTTVTLSGSGVLSTGASAQSQYSANQSYSGTFDIAQGSASTGRDTNNTYSAVASVSSPPAITSVSPGSGSTAGGTSVTLSGTGFSSSGNSVVIGGVSATPSAESSTSITFTTPAHAAGSVDIVVTTADGQSVTSTNAYTYVASPTTTGVTPNSGPTAGGTSVVIQGTAFTGATAVSFGGSPATGVVVNSATQITAVSPAGSAGTVSVSVTTPGGTGTLSNAFVYVAAPTITSVSPAAGPTVGGTSVTVTGTNLSSATGVAFGGVAGTITANTATSITVTAPAGAGVVDVAVTTAGGVATAVSGYAYAAAPTISGVSPNTGPETGGTTVTLTGINLTNASAVTFGGNAATITANTATSITATVPAGAGSVGVAVTTAGGTATAVNAYSYIPTLSVTPGAATGTSVGGAFSQSNPASGGTAPYVYALASGALPAGVSLNTATGAVTGTPTTAGAFAYAIQATDSQGTPATAIGATVSGTIAKGAQTISFAALADASLSASPLTVSATSSSGLAVAFTSATTGVCTVSGTSVTLLSPGTCTLNADQAGDANWNAATQVQRSFTVTAATLSVTPGAATGTSVGGAFSQSNPASGGTAPYVYALASGALPAGVSLNTATGAVTGTPTTAGAFAYAIQATDSQGTPATAIGATVSGTIAKGAQTISFAALADASLSASPLTVSATSSSGLAVAFTSATTGVCTVSGTSVTLLSPGTCTLNADQAGDANWNAATQVQRSFTVTAATLSVTPGAATGTSVGGAFSQSNPASGGTAPYVYALASGALPAGVSLNTATGAVTGTPTTAGAFAYAIQATDSQGTPATATGATVSGTIAKGTQTISFTSTAPAATVPGPVYTVAAVATSGLNVSFSLDAASTGCALAGAAVTFTGPGTCVINADQAGDANWTAAARVQQSFAVTAAAPIAADVTGVAVPFNSPGTAIDLSSAITGGAHGSVVIVTAPAHGAVTVAGDVLTYVPTSGYFGPDSLTYQAVGAGGVSNTATVSLTVAVPAAPVASDRVGVTVAFNSAGTAVDLSGSISGVRTSIAIATAPAHGAATVSGEVVTYRPTADYSGADSFTYVATGPGGASAPATVSLIVEAPAAPVVTPPAAPVAPPPPSGSGPQPVKVPLAPNSSGVVTGYRVDAPPQNGVAAISGDGSAADPWVLTYTPAANFLGTETVSVVATGPGGDSAPAAFVIQVAGKAPDFALTTRPGAPVTITPTTGLVGGPFNGLRITRPPTSGSAVVEGLTIVFTPAAANTSLRSLETVSAAAGVASLAYVIDLPFGASAPGEVSLAALAVPGEQALTAATLQGVPVTVRIDDTTGGPFIGAAVVSVAPTTAGSATLTTVAGERSLTFTPATDFTGEAVITFSLTNAAGSTNGVLTVTVEGRPDPGLDPEVRGVATAQATSARRFADVQLNNFQRRLQALRSGTNGSSNGLSLNFGLGGLADRDNDPRQALRQALGARDPIDPGALNDRSRDALGLETGVGGDAVEAAASTPRSNTLSAAPKGSQGVGSVGFWTAGSIDWGRQDAAGQRDYRFTTQGVTVGLDYQIADGLVVGGGLGYGEDRTKVGDNGTVSNGSAFSAALYGSWRPTRGLYVDGVAGVSDLDFDARRWVSGLAGQPNGYAASERSGEALFASAAFGRLRRSDRVTTDLYARIDAREITLDGFTETGGGYAALVWDGVDQSSLSTNLGAALRWVADTRSAGVITASARLEWSHELEEVGRQTVRYADWAASPSYLVPLDAWSRNALKLDLGADWQVSDRLLLGLGYRGQLGDASVSHGAELRFTYGW
ncbi:MAG: IPT/TIG domain-containing protein [Brevundimonas aurantiaca]|uniref:IPT/TIG domain-containing protein n=1 Tax=Brevundimonas aurantiaca TaxID=74316 RepID=UPI00391C5EB2